LSSSDEPPNEPSGESPGIRPESSGPIAGPPPDDTETGILRRHPTGPIPEPEDDDTRTSIIRRHPTEDLDEAQTSLVPRADEEPETGIIRPPRRRISRTSKVPTNATAVAASAVSIISGWATALVATDLITGWWHTDRLFCVGVGFLTAVFAASTIGGVVGLLLRRRVGIFLSIVAAVLALLIFAGIFVAGAHTAGVVRAIPVLPVATAALTLAPATWRWTKQP
jgi:hypothetical protein